jgi:hypothetical protein
MFSISGEQHPDLSLCINHVFMKHTSKIVFVKEQQMMASSLFENYQLVLPFLTEIYGIQYTYSCKKQFNRYPVQLEANLTSHGKFKLIHRLKTRDSKSLTVSKATVRKLELLHHQYC